MLIDDSDSNPPKPFKLEDGVFRGEPGLEPGFDLSDWTQIKELIYIDDDPPELPANSRQRG